MWSGRGRPGRDGGVRGEVTYHELGGRLEEQGVLLGGGGGVPRNRFFFGGGAPMRVLWRQDNCK